MFHEGERQVQRRGGVERVATQVASHNITPWIPPEFGQFLARQPFVVIAGADRDERVWASPLAGGIGFARALDDHRVILAADPPAGDPLEAALEHARIGVLAIEFATRLRIRLNGVAERTPDGIVLTVEEAFGNCPKFIQRRLPTGPLEPARVSGHKFGHELDPEQVRSVSRADTFFIASAHHERGADASHRGGRPGFVEVSGDGRELVFPDYAGNRMFQTLGNLTADPRAGLLFLDWESGAALQLTGRAEIVWDRSEVAAWPGAERLVRIGVEAVHERAGAMPACWELIEPSRLNPPTRSERA
jgi:predicted pyridoxine 5'-phosphate oxidase superfamily flavin-nucleotide-binding protein